MRKQLYLDIKNRLKTVAGNDGQQLFLHFDLWNRQVEFLEQETPFACPAVFVEFGEMEWKTLGQRVQECGLTVRLHIVTEWHAGTSDYSPTEQQALEFLDITDRVVAALQGFSASYMNSWMRTRSITNHDHETYVDNIEEYNCLLRDQSACKQYESVQAHPMVNVQ
ncbi:MAG TPA: hypothetical protein PKW49_03400 [Paludibacteraceae bacterium]|nr:hypothetical protein [Paludibacteraceae bacterium]